jgi:hypothetical protein
MYSKSDLKMYDTFNEKRAAHVRQMMAEANAYARRKAAIEEVDSLIGKLNTLRGSSATEFENAEIDACIELVRQRNGGGS